MLKRKQKKTTKKLNEAIQKKKRSSRNSELRFFVHIKKLPTKHRW